MQNRGEEKRGFRSLKLTKLMNCNPYEQIFEHVTNKNSYCLKCTMVRSNLHRNFPKFLFHVNLYSIANVEKAQFKGEQSSANPFLITLLHSHFETLKD